MYRNALIVGGTSGLGQAVAHALTPLAECVHITYNDSSGTAEKLANEVAENGGRSQIHQLTLPDEDPKGTRVREIFTAASPCDVVVNCAVANDAALATIANAERFRAVADANIFGTYQVNSIAAQAMAASGGGVVVNISSILTRKYIVGAMGYIASKAAIEAMTRGFAREFGALNVRFNTVSPGPIRDTQLLKAIPHDVLEKAMGGPDFEDRLLPPEQVAEAITAVASPRFLAVNGETIVVDDGFSL